MPGSRPSPSSRVMASPLPPAPPHRPSPRPRARSPWRRSNRGEPDMASCAGRNPARPSRSRCPSSRHKRTPSMAHRSARPRRTRRPRAARRDRAVASAPTGSTGRGGGPGTRCVCRRASGSRRCRHGPRGRVRKGIPPHSAGRGGSPPRNGCPDPTRCSPRSPLPESQRTS